MTYELYVWSSKLSTDVKQAGEISDQLTQDWVVVHQDPAFDAFMEELNMHWPNFENSPWASSPHVNGCAVELSITSGQAGATEDIVYDASHKHGLVVYNPQAGRLDVPPAVRTTANRLTSPSIHLILTESASGVEMRLLDKDVPVICKTVSSRDEARARARSYAVERKALLYSVTDSAIRPPLLPRKVTDLLNDKSVM